MNRITTLETQLGRERLSGSVGWSVLLHCTLLGVVLGLTWLAPTPGIVLFGGPGGGQDGETMSVSLVGNLDGGDGSLYKPSLKMKDTVEAVPAPAPDQKSAPDKPVSKEREAAILIPERAKSTRIKLPPAPPQPVETPAAANKIPNQIAEAGSGGAPSSGGSGGGYGDGIGLEIGSGDNSSGEVDNWYARQVRKRIGDNWLRSSLLAFEGRRLRAVLSFVILDDGRLDEIDFEERSGSPHYDMAAYRAIQAANPLPSLPPEFRSRRIKFVAYFRYPVAP